MLMTRIEFEALTPYAVFGYFCQYKCREWLMESDESRELNNEDFGDAFLLFQRFGVKGAIHYLVEQNVPKEV